MWTPPTFETERLMLRPLTMADAPAIFTYASNPLVAQYVPWSAHKTIADTESYLQDHIFAHYEREEPEALGVVLKGQSDTVIGVAGAWWSRPAMHAMELGAILDVPYWGNGYALEVAQGALSLLFANYPVHRVWAKCHVDNIGSQRVMEKIGMTCEGLLRAVVCKEGQYLDMYSYSILRNEWD